MKRAYYALVLVAALLLGGTAFAQHKHGDQKGPNGGLMEDVAGVHAELVTSGNTITINVFDEAGKPVATAGFSASALVVAGADRETTSLSPTGQNSLKGDLKKVATKGAAVTLMLKTGDGKSGQARFKP